jgi:YHS domain-containing protein
MGKLVVALAVSMSAVTLSAQAPPVLEALDGVDPVVLVTQGKEVFGKSNLRVERGRFAYLFATPESKAAFESAPEKYEIQLGGLCAKMGRSASGNPSDFAVVDGKIYVFGSDDCHKQFVAAPAKFLPPAPVPMPASDAARTAGRALVDRIVDAMGGAARVDAVTSYAETSTRLQRTPQGDVPAVTRTTWRFPGGVRMERSMQANGQTMRFGTLVTPDGVWGVNMQGALVPGNPAGRPALEQEFGRRLVPLFRSRQTSDFVAVALEPITLDGAAMDRARIQRGPVDVTLAVDRATGLVRRATFVDRSNAGGEYGEYTIVYGDYRDVGGIKVPFSEKALFNGVPDETATRTLDAITINAPVDPALFAAGGAR